jgi:hypothetical protein
MGWEIIDRLREERWFVFLFSILLLALNIGCSKKSSGGEGISNKEISNLEKCPVWYKDEDGDGYTDGTTKVSCEKPAGYVSQALPGDCKDNDPNINPAKAEICDDKDNNCNGQTDEGVLLVFYKDFDEDGYTDGTTRVSCSKPAGYVLSATPGDCKDNDPNINPGKTEICDNKDNNCNGQTDEGNVCVFAGAKVSAGGAHTCAIKQDGSLWCWGYNLDGQVGDGTNSDKVIPVKIMSSGVSSVALGGYHTCAIKQDGSLWCWGLNSDGQLGDGTGTNRNTPVRVINPSGSGGGGAPSIFFGDKSSFGNMEQRWTIYGCSSANIVFYVLHLIFPTFILFALLKRKFVR